jgi:hypothetical protein
VAEAVFLRAEVARVARVRRRGERLGRDDVDAGIAQPPHLARVVGDETDRPHAERPEHGRGVVVASPVDREAEAHVRLDRVGASVLLDVGPQLVDEPDGATLLAGRVHEHPTLFRGDRAEREAQLNPTVASKRPENVAGEAFGVQSGQHVVAAGEVAENEREVDVAGAGLERSGVERAERRREGHADGLCQRPARR